MAKPLSSYSDEEVLKLWRDHGENAARAAATVGCGPSTFKERIRLLRDTNYVSAKEKQAGIAFLVEELEARGLDPRDITIERAKVSTTKNAWDTTMAQHEKDGTVTPITTKNKGDRRNVEIIFSPKFVEGPKWPVIEPAKPTKIEYRPPTIIIPKGLRIEVVLPDTQFGFQRDIDSRIMEGGRESFAMLPMHDEAALDVALQIIASVQPDGLTHVGDLMDFSEFSKYLQVEEFWRTTQPAIDAAHVFLAQCSSAMGEQRKGRPKKKRRLVTGNHDDKRVGTYLQTNARSAYGLRKAMATPESWPLYSLPSLLRTDEIGWEYMGTWPGSEAWLVEGENGLVVVHDPQKRGDFQASVIAGHTHRIRRDTFTTRTPFGRRTFSLYEVGCLCSLDRIASKTAIQRTRVPSDRGWVDNWAQGVTVVEILEATGAHQVTCIQIDKGEAIYAGQRFSASKRKAA